MGLLGGLKSIFYIVILLILTLYLFAVTGIIFFRDNDPYHFRSIEISLLYLFDTTTLDSWGDTFYTSFYGCDIYDSSGIYTNYRTLDDHVRSNSFHFNAIPTCPSHMLHQLTTNRTVLLKKPRIILTRLLTQY